MQDLISRQAAIEELPAQDVYTEQDVRTAYADGYSDGIHRGYEAAVRHYKNLALKLCEKEKSDDLISRQEALKGFAEHSDGWCYINALLPAEPSEIIRCKDCKWWDKKDDSPYGYCHAVKHGYHSSNWEIGIYRLYKSDFFCADGERRETEDNDV